MCVCVYVLGGEYNFHLWLAVVDPVTVKFQVFLVGQNSRLVHKTCIRGEVWRARAHERRSTYCVFPLNPTGAARFAFDALPS